MTLTLLPSHSETGPASLRMLDREHQHLELHNWRGRVGMVPGPLFIGDRRGEGERPLPFVCGGERKRGGGGGGDGLIAREARGGI